VPREAGRRERPGGEPEVFHRDAGGMSIRVNDVQGCTSAAKGRMPGAAAEAGRFLLPQNLHFRHPWRSDAELDDIPWTVQCSNVGPVAQLVRAGDSSKMVTLH